MQFSVGLTDSLLLFLFDSHIKGVTFCGNISVILYDSRSVCHCSCTIRGQSVTVAVWFAVSLLVLLYGSRSVCQCYCLTHWQPGCVTVWLTVSPSALLCVVLTDLCPELCSKSESYFVRYANVFFKSFLFRLTLIRFHSLEVLFILSLVPIMRYSSAIFFFPDMLYLFCGPKYQNASDQLWVIFHVYFSWLFIFDKLVCGINRLFFIQ